MFWKLVRALLDRMCLCCSQSAICCCNNKKLVHKNGGVNPSHRSFMYFLIFFLSFLLNSYRKAVEICFKSMSLSDVACLERAKIKF